MAQGHPRTIIELATVIMSAIVLSFCQADEGKNSPSSLKRPSHSPTQDLSTQYRDTKKAAKENLLSCFDQWSRAQVMGTADNKRFMIKNGNVIELTS
jgi:hypothetical protein